MAPEAPIRLIIKQATTTDEIYDLIRKEFLPKLASLFQIGHEKLTAADLNALQLDEMGIDSLLAVEIRSWFAKTLEVNIPVLKILSGISIKELIDSATDILYSSIRQTHMLLLKYLWNYLTVKMILMR